MKIVVTGCAGFIGSYLCEALLKRGDNVYGIDNVNDYYSQKQKLDNLKILYTYPNFYFTKGDIVDTDIISRVKPQRICHLAAMAGVRYSIKNPLKYAKTNILGTLHLLEECIKNDVKYFIYASSSSVYGKNEKVPFSETDVIMRQNSSYACSKLCCENYARYYNQLHGIYTTGLRFFTVYGPRGRPDMAPYKFLNAIKNNKEIKLYGTGSSFRDYTYINDIIDGTVKAIDNCNGNNIFNLGYGNPISLNNFVKLCEKVTNKNAKIKYVDEMEGDVFGTFADIKYAKKKLDYEPKTDLETGLKKMWEWLNNYESQNNIINITNITKT
jgi:UDP-glucuronate 4-epimerase